MCEHYFLLDDIHEKLAMIIIFLFSYILVYLESAFSKIAWGMYLSMFFTSYLSESMGMVNFVSDDLLSGVSVVLQCFYNSKESLN